MVKNNIAIYKKINRIKQTFNKTLLNIKNIFMYTEN